jgi:hypothetical protein
LLEGGGGYFRTNYVLGISRREVTGSLRKLQHEKLHPLDTSLNIIRAMKQRMVR